MVEKCNINVRTIQRIEAGDVSPRSYTITAILEVLGVDYFEEEQKESVTFTAKEKKILSLAWIFGVVHFFIGFIETAADFYQFTDAISLLNNSVYIVCLLYTSPSPRD